MQKITEKFVRELLKRLNESSKKDLARTPKRTADTFAKIFSGYQKDPKEIATTFDNEGYDEMIVVKDIDFYSSCEHHLLPFFGKAYIGYIPDKRIIGLSKIPRLVEIYSRRLQNQERLTSQIADALVEILKPKGAGVVLEARHLCMMARGVEKQGARIVTSAMRGLFKKKMNTRAEFLRLIGR